MEATTALLRTTDGWRRLDDDIGNAVSGVVSALANSETGSSEGGGGEGEGNSEERATSSSATKNSNNDNNWVASTESPFTTTGAPSEVSSSSDSAETWNNGNSLASSPVSDPPSSLGQSNDDFRDGEDVDTNQGNRDEEVRHLSVATIVGITLACVAFVLGIAGLIFWMFRRRRRQQRQDRDSDTANAAEKRSKREESHYNLETPSTASASTGNFASMQGALASSSNNSSQMSSLRVQGGMWEDDAIATVRIPLEKVERTSLLNRGGYGEVYRGMYHGEVVAIKMLLPATRRDIAQINAFLAEVKLMAAMEHDRIVRFIGVAWDSLSDLCAVSEYMEGGDLRTLLTQFEARERRPKGFDRDKARIALHVMHALTYLHSLDPVVLHRDLKSKNILLTADLDAKITDFGVSRESSDKTMTAGVGTSLWMAPEVMMGERYDEKADMFSFGVVLSELDSHLLPYAMAKETDSGRVLPDTALLQMVSLGRLRIEMSANAPQAVVDLAYACVDVDPEKRPTAVEALYKLQLILKMHEDFVL